MSGDSVRVAWANATVTATASAVEPIDHTLGLRAVPLSNGRDHLFLSQSHSLSSGDAATITNSTPCRTAHAYRSYPKLQVGKPGGRQRHRYVRHSA